ncbi:hypothetical protein VYU27_007574 [Nannochloropsis oceanica]
MLHVPNTNPAHRQHPHRRRQHATNYDLSVTAFLPSAIWEGSSEFKLLIRTSVVGAFSSVFAQPDLSINFQPAFDASVIQQPNKTDTAAHKQVTPVCVAGSRSVVGNNINILWPATLLPPPSFPPPAPPEPLTSHTHPLLPHPPPPMSPPPSPPPAVVLSRFPGFSIAFGDMNSQAFLSEFF